ncbi:MAG: winged helix-turn-helix transcriptional regulator [Anaerolineales bacterium]
MADDILADKVMGSTRNLVLQQLLSQQRCTIIDLAKAVKINPISVRHHIGRLEAEGLVESAEERHGVGRPRRQYYLTEAGMEHFPARTIRFTNQLLAELKHELPQETYRQLFTRMADRLVDQYTGKIDLASLELDARLSLIETWLTNEGFTVQIEHNEEQIVIKEIGCPYYYVGQEHSEVCSMDKALIAKVLEADPRRTTCLLSGDSHCTYVIPLEAIHNPILN